MSINRFPARPAGAFCFALVGLLAGCASTGQRPAASEPAGVIFIHPDGAGMNAWAATRMLEVGPDNDLHWDRLPEIGVYRGHLTDALAATSNAGGTIHAFGVKVGHASFGNDNGAPIPAPAQSVARRALQAGKAVAIVTSASIADAGTGTFLADVPSRRNYPDIARQMLDARPQVLLGGGESYFLPKGVRGRHGEGIREDGRNLIEEAAAAGYTVVYTADELAAAAPRAERLLGLFASVDTFNDDTEEKLRAEGTPYYVPTAPTIAQMVDAALTVVSRDPDGFIVIAEEEGSDNFGGDSNARGMMLALKRADDALGVALRFLDRNPRTLLLTCADSDCGGMQVLSDADLSPDAPLPAADEWTRSAIDGRDGTSTPPFIAAPDARGRRLPFAIGWAAGGDVAGAVLVRGAGYRAAEVITPTMDNTAIEDAMRRVLFGE